MVPSRPASLLALVLLLGPLPAFAQGAEPRPDASLSPQCRVPGSELYTLAPLRSVKRALKERRPVRVLAIGSSSTVGVGASSPQASYAVRLEGELEKSVPGVDVEIANRGVSGEAAAGAAERMLGAVAETRADLVVWQVGTNDALRKVDLAAFRGLVDETVRRLKGENTDVVLVDPQYGPDLARDADYERFVDAVEEVARIEGVPVVRRFDAMRYLAGERPTEGYLAGDRLHLNDLGHRCMAEHVARAIAVSLVQADAPVQATVADAPGAPVPSHQSARAR